MANNYCLCLLLILSAAGTHAQNLIKNGGFDTLSNCPISGGQINLARPWYTPSRRTTDLIHACGFFGLDPEDSRWGKQTPISGRGYAGLRLYLETSYAGERNYREYLAAPLRQPMQAGHLYYTDFYVSAAEVATLFSDDIAVYFSPDTIPPDTLLTYTPAFRNPEGRLLASLDQWTRVGGTYLAQGGERHIVIGNFLDDDHTTLVSRVPAGGTERTVYLFVEDVEVKPCGPAPVDYLQVSDTVLCPGETVTLEAVFSSPHTYTWLDGGQAAVRTVGTPGWYGLKVQVGACEISDSVYIHDPLPPNLSPAEDLILCPGESLLLAVRDTAVDWQWMDAAIEPVREISTPGLYVLASAAAGCTRFDTVQVRLDTASLTDQVQALHSCAGDTLSLLQAGTTLSYQWADGDYAVPRLVTDAGRYVLELIGACSTTTWTWDVTFEACPCEIFVPNVFTPNGDGIHDVFQPQYGTGVQAVRWYIYDRWGQIVAQGQDMNSVWAPERTPTGVYFWTIDLTCKAGIRQHKGSLTLLR